MSKDHKVLIYGDSHSRGLSSGLNNKLSDAFDVLGYTKPNCNIRTLLSTENREIANLTNKDVCTRFNKDVTILETPKDRDYYTRHGYHLNGLGKEIICKQLASVIDGLFQPIEVIPITLDWKNNQAMSLELEATSANSDFSNTVSKGNIENGGKVEELKACRVSSRQKKVPTNRTGDFYGKFKSKLQYEKNVKGI
ncbi:hypothetical protein B7P43_G11638 [Cryptotermes secundus]|uniref:Uncharacterized protein n=1 Tax=Cryptotermes secundus TaxID=105785 RepID=A0A2J7PIT7_9NEOP|nr:hypothetical protein B7P43_G11638 [Cryptotermes secundus]